MAITDHINMQGTNPLVGPNDDAFGPRFPSLTDAWNPDLTGHLAWTAEGLGIDLATGVYAAWLGPTFETPAEVRMLKLLGADAVGMSTVPECIVARHCGLDVVGCAVITNLGVGLGDGEVSHDQTLRAANAAAADLERLIVGFLEGLDR
jgi:xanthosine phosphorylase